MRKKSAVKRRTSAKKVRDLSSRAPKAGAIKAGRGIVQRVPVVLPDPREPSW